MWYPNTVPATDVTQFCICDCCVSTLVMAELPEQYREAVGYMDSAVMIVQMTEHIRDYFAALGLVPISGL